MSVDANALERATLERKDREELLAIAQALGGKPGSRAKKADIVDLILQLTGVTDAAPAPEAAPEVADPAVADAPAAEADDESAEDDEDDDAAAEDEADDDDADEAEPTAARPAAEARPARRDDRGGNQGGGQGQGQRGPRPAAGGGPQGGAPSAAPGGAPGGNGASSAGPAERDGEGDGEGDEDTGNRRRRRRGRNRGDGANGAEEPFGEPIEVTGIVDLRDEGYGFLRLHGYLPSRDDAYISVKQARQFGLRRGDLVTGTSRPALRNEKNPALLRIDEINGAAADPAGAERPRFEAIPAVFPTEPLTLERDGDDTDATARAVELITPIGKGQRALVASPPKAGKTSLLQDLARSIEANHPDVALFVVLVDERPEEATDWQRTLGGDTTVLVSTFDRPVDEHVAVAELALERAKRLAESGRDAVVLLDGITRLARAYNLATPGSGRTLAGGVDVAALFPPKRYLGAARKLEGAGSLTVVATAVVETASEADLVIYEELADTANLVLRLDRHAAERRTFPAIDVGASSTSREELLVDEAELERRRTLRRALQDAGDAPGAVATALRARLDADPTNAGLLAR